MVSVTEMLFDVVSPHWTVAVWVSRGLASANVALIAIGVVIGICPVGAVTATVGATLLNVNVADDVAGVWNPSVTDNVAVTIASSLHVTVGCNVLVAAGVHVVPGLAAVTPNDHDVCTGSPSGSIADACKATVLLSAAEYGPPAAAAGAALWRVKTRT